MPGAGQVKDRILRNGYLPEQISPLFTSTVLAERLNHLGELPTLRSDGGTGAWTEPVRFSAARPMGFRRQMAVPNPHSYLVILDQVELDWELLFKHWRASTASESFPRLSDPRHGVDDGGSFRRRDSRRLDAAMRSRFRLKTDIAQCYGSIYTHSLSWALGGKRDAKANIRNLKFPGNSLDMALRNAQDGQTVGVPIGPESSLIAAETVLCAIDQAPSLANSPVVDWFRSIDDYEVYTRSRSDAEAFLQHLGVELSHYGLVVNIAKTAIEEAPFLIEDHWMTRITALTPPDERVGKRHVQAFINEVFALAKAHPDQPVVSYALRMSESLQTGPQGNALLVKAALASLQFSKPSIRFALLAAMKRLVLEDGDRSALWDCLNTMIAEAAPVEHSYEVVWGCWALLLSDGRLERPVAEKVAEMQDPLALTAYHHLLDLRRADGPGASRLAELHLESGTERSDSWILAYEAMRRGWADAGSITSSDFFNALATLEV